MSTKWEFFYFNSVRIEMICVYVYGFNQKKKKEPQLHTMQYKNTMNSTKRMEKKYCYYFIIVTFLLFFSFLFE